MHKIPTDKISVVFVITSLGTGGAQMMLYKLLTRIDREKFSPTVVTLIPGGMFSERIAELDVPIYDLGMRQGMPNISSLMRLRKLLRQLQPKVIQGWMYHGNLMASLGKFMSRGDATVFWSVHQSLASISAEKKVLAMLIRITARLSKSVKTVVFSAESGLKQHLAVGYHDKNVLAIRDNFDLDSFKVTDAKLHLRQTLGLAEESVLVASVARYAPMKDHANLVSAAALLTTDFTNLHFVCVGPGVDSKNQKLTNQIAQLKLEERIHLLGERRDIQSILSEVDIFALSSAFSESFPNVLGEAMACHVPCVTTDVGDAYAIVGDVGIVVPPGDSIALAAGLRKLLEMSSQQRADLGRQSRLHIEDQFNLDGADSFVRKYERLYEDAQIST